MEQDPTLKKGKMMMIEDGSTSQREVQNMVFNGDCEKPELPVWRDSAARRGGEFQFMKDAPLNLPCLRHWLKDLKTFQETTKYEVPDYDKVSGMNCEGWDGTWSSIALRQFVAVANATGVMHPPRNKKNQLDYMRNQVLSIMKHLEETMEIEGTMETEPALAPTVPAPTMATPKATGYSFAKYQAAINKMEENLKKMEENRKDL